MSAARSPPPHEGCQEPPFTASIEPTEVAPVSDGRCASAIVHAGGGGDGGTAMHAVSGPPTSPAESHTVLREQTCPAAWSAAVTTCVVPCDPSVGQYTSTAASGGEQGFHWPGQVVTVPPTAALPLTCGGTTLGT